MEKSVFYFTPEYIERSKKLTPEQILDFLENYKRAIYEVPEKCQQINLKIEPSLLKAFKQRANLENVPYQTLIKKLMREYLTGSIKR